MFFKRYTFWILVALAFGIRIFALFPEAVEKYYTHGIYPVIGIIQRTILGWIPFSIGDLLYAAAVVYLIVGVVKFVRKLILRKANRAYFFSVVQHMVMTVLWIYVLFNVLWGLNYNRVGIAQQLQLEVSPYTKEELVQVIELTIDKLRETDTAALQKRALFAKKSFLFSEAYASYDVVEREYPFLKYNHHAVKPSLFSYLGNYLGYTGYYNPFSGEAQVNTTVPVFLQSFTTSHEIGHQLGYAKENEANFVGYLAAKSSPEPAVRYSVYLDLYIYASRNLFVKDSSMARSLYKKLPDVAKNDLAALRKFYKDYENPFEPVIRKLYGQYLKANQQPQGILTYDEVIGWVVAYYRKNGKI